MKANRSIGKICDGDNLDLDFDIEVINISQYKMISKPCTFKIEFSNKTNKVIDFATIYGTKLFYSYFDNNNEYFDRSDVCFLKEKILYPFSKISGVLTIKTKDSASRKDIPQEIMFRIGEDFLFSVPLYMDYFIEKIYHFNSVAKEQRNHNILLFGLPGATKSSFLNSVFTLVSSSNKIFTGAISGGGLQHVTRRLSRYIIPNTRIALWDCWGIDPKDYNRDVIIKLINGQLPPDFDVAQHNYNTYSPVHNKQVIERRINQIFFFIPHTIFTDPNTPLELIQNIRKLMDMFDEIKYYHNKWLHPIIIISRVDEIDIQARADPLRCYEINPLLKQIKEKAANLFNVQEDQQVFFNVNYVYEECRSFQIDKAIYFLLDEVIHAAT